MNRELLTQIAEWLEAGAPHKAGISQFNMNKLIDTASYTNSPNPIHGCGTACCIAGAAIQFTQENKNLPPMDRLPAISANWQQAGELLRLQDDLAYALFFGENLEGKWIVDLEEVTAKDAAKVIRHLLATGEVDWNLANCRKYAND